MNFSIYETTAEWAVTAGLVCISIPEITSTNDLAKDQAFEETEALSLYVTDHQTKGRGRGVKTWTDDEEGTALLSSWSFLLLKAPQPVLAPTLGLALFKAAQSTWLGLPWSLKAPNDLYLGDKKIAGLTNEDSLSVSE